MMIQFKTQKPKIALLLDNTCEITFTTNKANIRNFENLPDKELEVTIKEYRQRRSMSQNSYLWVLLNELAIKLNTTKEEIYKQYIKDYGVFSILPVKNEAAESFKSKWGKNGIGWFCEDLGESKLNGFNKIIAYFGSSTYSTEEMKRVIDAVVTDCEENGIPVMTMNEIMLLKNEND